ncbi:hypothetical protein BMT55_16560 [Listeria newyorkensis]|uniref:Uncharacterized protein n=1 Tax=Listeria newyorkensis TaxID=1497681 RepID=A0ABX4XIL5_9LIST|nr:hypothetical protein [Listeria newyorkensis]PNP87046.1 hypothetical protein BMT55_16560 [Listeria newyorkensis]
MVADKDNNFAEVIVEALSNTAIEGDDTKSIDMITSAFIFLYHTTGMPYREITELMFENNFETEKDMEIINANIDLIELNIDKLYKDVSEDLEKYSKIPNKLRRHFGLAMVQKKYINRMINDLNQDVSVMKKDVKNESKKLDRIVEETEKRVSDIKATKGQIYTEFVAILGIFSALLFGLFGGFQAVAQSIATIAKGDTSIEKILMLVCLILGSLSLLMFSLMQGVTVLSKTKFRSCDCPSRAECNHPIFVRHPVVSMNILILFVIFMISLISLELPNSWLTTWINLRFWGLIIIFVVMLGITGWYYFKHRNWKEKEKEEEREVKSIV